MTLYPPILYPDAAAMLCTAFAASLSVPTGTTVPTDRTDSSTFLLVRRVGGPNRDIVVDDASLAIEAWAPTEAAAHDLLQQARAELHALTGTVVDGVAVYRVQEFAGPASLPDPLSSQPRYTMTVSVSVRGTAIGS